jgi:LPXTG-motif cell wall-anchored protein
MATATPPPAESGMVANASYVLFGIAGVLTAVFGLIWWKRK